MHIKNEYSITKKDEGHRTKNFEIITGKQK